MRNSSFDWISKLARYTLLAGAALFVLVYLYLVFFRIRYPFELEWMEGGMVDHVRWILSGEKLYVSPSLEFVPYVYPPLYFYLSALISKIIGVGFTPLRLLSFISSLGCFVFIFLMVKQETKSSFSGFLASCLFVATFRITGAWFDIARVDSLFLFLLLATIYLIRFKTSPKWYVLAGVLMSLSFLTKQTALVISLPIMLYCVLVNRRLAIYFIGTAVAIVVLSTLVLDLLHDGWYTYYLFDLPRHHPKVGKMILTFWVRDIISSPLSITFAMSIFYLLAQVLSSNKDNYRFYLLLTMGMLGGAWLSRLHSGGYVNDLFPAYALISILFGLATRAAFELIQSIPSNKRKVFEFFVYLVCMIQFCSLIYNPLKQIPTRNDLEAGKEFISQMAKMEGEILLPYHGYLPTLAGKKSYAHVLAISEVLRGDQGEINRKLTEEIRQAIREKQFSAIFLDEEWFQEEIEQYYIKHDRVFKVENVFKPITGTDIKPEYIYVPKNDDTD